MSAIGRMWPIVALAFATSGWLHTSQAIASEQSDAAKVRVNWNVPVRLRDGTVLNATVYVPKDVQTPGPCVTTLTPYMADTYHDRGVYFAAHGLSFAIVDVRGRGNSEGQFRPMIQEAQDGYDVVEWLAHQPYCNGKVGMWGGSYAGYAQWAVAKEFPPNLATIAPASSPYMGVDWPMRYNIFVNDEMQWLTLTGGRVAQWQIYNDKSFWAVKGRDWFESGAPYDSFDVRLGNPSGTFREWLAHPKQDRYWDSYNPTSEQYRRLAIPVLTITGVYDGDQPGALAHYRQHLRNAAEGSAPRHFLVIGPWDHDGTRTPKSEVGGVKLGPASLLDLNKLHLEWYAWAMQVGPLPQFLQKPIAYYVLGAEEWRYADTLAAVTAHMDVYFLRSTSNPTDVLAAGTLTRERPLRAAPDHYVYDPRDVSSAGLQSSVDPDRLVDQRLIYAGSGKQLVYHTAPFKEDTELNGFFKLTAWLSIDQPDTDFSVSIFEIGIDGGSILLTTDMMRARYRESLEEAKLIHTQQPLRFDFEHFAFVARRVKQGSRLRLVLGPINSIYSEKNYNAGGVVAEESVRDARPVTVTLYHDRAHPSALIIPFGQPHSPGEPTAPSSAFLSEEIGEN